MKEFNKDNVYAPSHYISTVRGVELETIDVIEAFVQGLNPMEAVCTANVIKYISRWKKKNGLEDLMKAKWYLEYLISLVEYTNKYEDPEITNINKYQEDLEAEYSPK